ncbi:hypothetical protein F7725_007236, partial [Dissostichus mawsoni]
IIQYAEITSTSEKRIIDGPNTRRPYDFKSFLGNELNKKQLCDLLLRVWGSNEAASRIEKSMKAVVQTSEIYELRSNQEETDSRIVLYLHQAVKWGYKSSVSKVDLERLPPPKVCLIPHVQRANYRVAFYKRADKAIIESPKPHDPGMGWEKTGRGGVLAQRAESEEHAALDKVTDYANNNLSVGEVDGEYEHEEELEMEEIELEDLFSDDEDDE